jgi:hypothetical protein
MRDVLLTSLAAVNDIKHALQRFGDRQNLNFHTGRSRARQSTSIFLQELDSYRRRTNIRSRPCALAFSRQRPT